MEIATLHATKSGFILTRCHFNFLRPVSNFCHLLTTLLNRLDPEQARQYVWRGMNLNCLTLVIFVKENFENIFL